MAIIKNLLPTRYKPITICGQSYPSTCVVYKRVHWYKKTTKKVGVFVRRESAQAQLPGQLSPARYADLCRGRRGPGLSYAHLTTNRPSNSLAKCLTLPQWKSIQQVQSLLRVTEDISYEILNFWPSGNEQHKEVCNFKTVIIAWWYK